MNTDNLSGVEKAIITGVAALALGGCATRGEQTLPRQKVDVSKEVVDQKAVLNPCTREGIKPRPSEDVTPQEMDQKTAAGQTHYVHAGYYLFSEPSVMERLSKLAGAVAGAALGKAIGGSGALGVAATVGGAYGGAIGGEFLANQAKLQKLSQESGCEAYLSNRAVRFVPVQDYRRNPYPRRRVPGFMGSVEGENSFAVSVFPSFATASAYEDGIIPTTHIVPGTQGQQTYVPDENTLIIK